jgi:hypothetical protein
LGGSLPTSRRERPVGDILASVPCRADTVAEQMSAADLERGLRRVLREAVPLPPATEEQLDGLLRQAFHDGYAHWTYLRVTAYALLHQLKLILDRDGYPDRLND